MFSIDNDIKREAVNYNTLLNVLGITEKKLNPMYDDLLDITKTSSLLNESRELLDEYAYHFKVDSEFLLNEFNRTLSAFETLEEDDEIIKYGSDFYPSLLSGIDNAPRFLYTRGNRNLLKNVNTVSIIGSRDASNQSKQNTRRLAYYLGKRGMTVVSGLALGIDVEAHKAALDYDNDTIAVLGNHLNQYYPMENRHVQKQIESSGLIVSQFSPAIKTRRWFYPLRNSVMSGMSQATIIMAARESSGTLRQADFAIKQKRILLISSQIKNDKDNLWVEKYLAKGAKLVENPHAVFDAITDINMGNEGIINRGSKFEQLSFDDLLGL